MKNDEKNHHKNEQKEEELYFDGQKYYSREDFFNPDEDNEPAPKKKFRWMKIAITFIIAIALMSNLLALWPKLFNMAAIEFLSVSKELSKNEAVQQYKESVVIVRAGNSKGTGFYFSNDGHIITNYHVIDENQKITVTFQDGESFSAEVIDSDDEIDIAILQINAKGLDYPILEFAEAWEPDQPIYIIGNPLFFNFIANKGNLIGLTPIRQVPMLVIDAPIYKGNSGSPVINYDGEVVGIVYATSTIEHDGSRKNVGLAIPIEYVREYVKR